ncbi:MAG: TIM barrel protein [Gemmatimonadota bacterium]|nr:TIM barrel protein [Gemmatimonadota bacterium]
MDRKGFLRAAGLGWGAAWLGGCARNGTPGSAGDGGGGDLPGGAEQGGAAAVAGLQPPLETIGVQLYTVRSLMADDVPRTLDAVAEIGYDEVEFAGYFGHEPAAVRAWLDASGLAAPAAHVDLDAVTGSALEETLAAAAVVGHRWLVVPWIPEAMRTSDGYQEVANLLNEAGTAAAGAGVRVGYHNHAFEFDVLNDPSDTGEGVTGYSLLLEHLDPALVDLEIDFHWSAVGGADALELFSGHPGRFPLCHVKDLTADGRMADAGAGVIDWPGLFARSEEAGLMHYFVEHDQPVDPLASIEASYRYLAAM